MPFHRFRVFTLEQANNLLPLVEDLTKRTRQRLQAVPAAPTATQEGKAAFEQRTRTILAEWARLVQHLGAQPKGIFSVDFRSPDPNVLWCWAPGELRICHRHFTWESFKDRVPVAPDDAAWPSLN